ncbi:MAG: hypothetical protein OXU61_00180, partial [Gammaproteobacteria bacterium]|nr:hypothetical protein [Gammaproteobacteria bacterium]
GGFFLGHGVLREWLSGLNRLSREWLCRLNRKRPGRLSREWLIGRIGNCRAGRIGNGRVD